MNKIKKLKRSNNNRILTGVLGGISEYFGWNSTIVRVIYAILSVLLFQSFFIGIWIYIIMAIIIPKDNSGQPTNFNEHDEFNAKPEGRKTLHHVKEHDHSDQ